MNSKQGHSKEEGKDEEAKRQTAKRCESELNIFHQKCKRNTEQTEQKFRIKLNSSKL